MNKYYDNFCIVEASQDNSFYADMSGSYKKLSYNVACHIIKKLTSHEYRILKFLY